MSIRVKLFIVGAFALLGLGLVFAVNMIGSDMIDKATRVETLALESEVQMLQARRREKDFLARLDPKLAVAVQEVVTANNEILDEIAAADPYFAGKAAQARELFSKYGASFAQVVEELEAMGLSEEDGLKGSLRRAIHKVEGLIDEQDSDILKAAMLMLRRREKDFMLRGDITYLDKFEADMATMVTQVKQSPTVTGDLQSNMLELLARYQEGFESYVAQFQAVEQGKQVFEDNVHDLEPVIEGLAADANDKRVEAVDRIQALTLAIEVVAGIVIMVAIILVIRSILGPLRRLQGYARDVAEGKCEEWDASGFSGELAALHGDITSMVAHLQKSMAEAEAKSAEAATQATKAAEALDEAREKEGHITTLMETMRTAADQAATISERLSSSATELAQQTEEIQQGAEIQSQRVSETATAMEEMNATVLDVAKSSEDAASSAEKGRDQAQAGKTEVASTIESISDIQASNTELASVMNDLANKAESIGNVMSVISDIADQTNLLALNAAIEAARAGEAGRGFAVVADEVRKLAEKTMSATSEVGQAIKGIQESVQSTVSKREVIEAALNRTIDRAHRAGEILDEIVVIVDHSTSMAQGIATAAEEQSATSEEITRTIEDINRISAETSAGVAQSVTAIQDVASLAENLLDIIKELKAAQ